VIVDGERFWIRNLRIAGNDITKALGERFKAPFPEAEKLKRSSAKSEKAKKIFGTMEPVLKDLVGEIHRSVGFFKSQAEDLDIKRMVLLGDGAKLRNLPKFFKEQLRFSVNRVKSLEEGKFFLGEDADVDVLNNHLLGFAVALGLAVQGVGQSRCDINLAPQDIQIQAQLRTKLPFAIATAVCAWAALGLSYTYWTGKIAALGETQSSMSKVTNWISTDQEGQQLANIAEFEQQAKEFTGVGKNRLLIHEFMKVLGQVLPQANDTFPSAPSDHNAELDTQLEQMRAQAETLNEDKTFILELKINHTPNLPKEQDLYTVTMTVAKPARKGGVALEERDVRAVIVREISQELEKRLSEAPFYLRTPDGTAYGQVETSPATRRFGLHPRIDYEPPQGKFEIHLVTITFQIGQPPAPPPPAEEDPNAMGGQ
jgi:Type IV pilus assembly protein PilM